IGISGGFANASALGKPNGIITTSPISLVTQNSRSCRNGLTDCGIAPRQTSYNCEPGSGITSITHSEGDATIAPNASGDCYNDCDALTKSHANFAPTKNSPKDAAANTGGGGHEFRVDIAFAGIRPFG